MRASNSIYEPHTRRAFFRNVFVSQPKVGNGGGAKAEDVFEGSGALPNKILADGSLGSEGRTPRGKLRMSQLHERWQRVAELPDHFEAPNTEPFDKVKTDTIRNCVTVPNGTAASAAP